jgi:hypothetical protein
MVLNDLLYSIDPNTMLLGLLFIIFYGLINLSLSRVFKKERSTSTVISLCVSLLAVYGINRTNLDISGLFYKVGISDTLIYAVVPWIILGLSFLFSFAKDQTGRRRFRFCRLLMILGAFLILLSFFAYQTAVVLIVGIVLIVLGLLLWLKIKKKLNLNFSGNKTTPGQKVNPNQGRDYLTKVAKRFHDWAIHQPKPRFVGNWAYFINYLKKGGLGRSEAEICQRLGISQHDLIHIFKKHGLVR